MREMFRVSEYTCPFIYFNNPFFSDGRLKHAQNSYLRLNWVLTRSKHHLELASLNSKTQDTRAHFFARFSAFRKCESHPLF